MLDMSWGEVMLIGGVALIVIGPKDLPKALRTVGQITTKLRRMAGEFQMQFNEAIREAELDEVRKEVDGIRDTMRGTSSFNPVQTIRDELRGAVEGKPAKPETAVAATTESFGPPKPEAAAVPDITAMPAPAPKPRSLADATARLKAERQAAQEPAPPVPGSVDDPYGSPAADAEPTRNGAAAQ
jgi:sec-independent protein translocase protein TatB